MDASCRNYRRKKELFTGVPNVTLVTPSHWLADLTRQSYLREYPVVVIPNGIDTEVFRPTVGNFRAEHHLENKTIILGVASVWDRRKGLSDFVKLSEMLDDTYKIVLVGLSKEQIQKLPSNIFGIERTNSTKELAELYTAADVFLNLSVEETFGLVTIEALACGTPVIVYNKTAIPETVNSSCGMVLEAGILHKLKQVLVEGQWREKLPECCVNNAKQFEVGAQFNRYLALYDYITSGSL